MALPLRDDVLSPSPDGRSPRLFGIPSGDGKDAAYGIAIAVAVSLPLWLGIYAVGSGLSAPIGG